MKLEITDEEILQIASENPQFKEIIQRLQPELFRLKNQVKLISADGFEMKHGDNIFSVYQKESFVKIEIVKSNACYASDWGHTRFKEHYNAEEYAYENNKKQFSISEIEHACFHSKFKKKKIKNLLAFFLKKE